MKLLLLLILIIFLNITISNCSLQGKLYFYNQDTENWEIILGTNPGSTVHFENQKPNFLFKDTVDPTSQKSYKFEINDGVKKDITITSSGGTSHWTFVDKFGELVPNDLYLSNWINKTYCARDNFASPLYFNFTCSNKVFPCSVSSRIDFGDNKKCKK